MKKLIYEKKVKPGFIQNMVRSKKLQTTVSIVGMTKKKNIKAAGR